MYYVDADIFQCKYHQSISSTFRPPFVQLFTRNQAFSSIVVRRRLRSLNLTAVYFVHVYFRISPLTNENERMVLLVWVISANLHNSIMGFMENESERKQNQYFD